MNIRRLSYGLLLTLATTLAAACGENPPPDVPTQPSALPAADTGAVPSPPPSADVVAPPPSATADATPPPASKPAKEKWVGKFAQDFSGEVKDAFEAAGKKTWLKEKDTKKHDDALKKASDAVATNIIENTADTHTYSQKGKAVHKVKFEVSGKDDPNNLTIKLGKDEVSKKDLKGVEVSITFKDDNTFEIKDPAAKDPKKAQTLVFKRQ